MSDVRPDDCGQDVVDCEKSWINGVREYFFNCTKLSVGEYEDL